ncbi:MAG TPA: HD domain-containing protein [Desulfurivibrio alkaliphilus]|mgnify:CR=1 FL=1|uniref:HD domain-containing protein n=1 Tax=Desulfurivibrio alkaliphilus TaxID=427923 RepID=A0A7C2TK64_9BACT|nr:HD domain-containing protein [Desulfurivibrio alkaliphilus]
MESAVDKGTMVAEIEEGSKVEGLFLVKEMNRGETKAGKPFLRLKVMDKSGEIGGPVWDDAEALAPLCRPGSYLRISGQGDSYQGSPQLRINRISPVDGAAIDPADFIPGGDIDLKQLAKELNSLIAEVGDPHLKRLLSAIFIEDRELRRRFTIAPAAKTMHHAYLGGLLEHSVALGRLALAVSRLYPAVDRDLLLAGALLHDLGKTEELTYDNYPFGYSNRGRLVGHLVIGAETVGVRAGQLPDFPAARLEQLQHLILSHHGRHEFGAPTLPMMQEAFILHFLDDLDAKLNYFARLGRQVQEPGYQWSEYQRNLERFLYLQGHPPEAPANPDAALPMEAEKDAGPEPPIRQKGLWG